MWEGQRQLGKAADAVADFLSDVRRCLPWLAIYLLVCLSSAVAYVEITPSDYLASAQILLQPRREVLIGTEDERIISETVLRNEQAQTDLNKIESRDLLRSVFNAQHLSDMPELQDGRDGVWAAVYHIAHRFAQDDAGLSSDEHAFERFTGRIRARLLADSAVVEIVYRSREPAAAAAIVNGIVAAFVRSQIERSLADLEMLGSFRAWDKTAVNNELRLATEAVSAGDLPRADLPDSDVRPLGPALIPIGQSFPRGGPGLALAATFAVVSGLLFVSIFNKLDHRIDTRDQLRRRLSLLCLGTRGAKRRVKWPWWRPIRGRGRTAPAAGDEWRAARAAIVRLRNTDYPPIVALVTPGKAGGGAVCAARRFADSWGTGEDAPSIIDLESEGRPLGLHCRDAILTAARGLPTPAGGLVVIVALPYLDDANAETSALLSFATAVFLVVESGRNNRREIMAALRLLRQTTSAFAGIVFQET